jgi:hypothetical protein
MTETTARQVDLELFQWIIDQICAKPHNWQQGSYFVTEGNDEVVVTDSHYLSDLIKVDIKEPSCGTALCVAGWAAAHRGYHFVVHSDDSESNELIHPDAVRAIEAALKAGQPEPEYTVYHPHGVGRDELGIVNDEAYDLFSGSNTLGDICAAAYMITDGRIELPAAVASDEFVDSFVYGILHARDWGSPLGSIYGLYVERNGAQLDERGLMPGGVRIKGAPTA